VSAKFHRFLSNDFNVQFSAAGQKLTSELILISYQRKVENDNYTAVYFSPLHRMKLSYVFKS